MLSLRLPVQPRRRRIIMQRISPGIQVSAHVPVRLGCFLQVLEGVATFGGVCSALHTLDTIVLLYDSIRRKWSLVTTG